ncbi:MAG: Ldh family oxidoreductase [Boseongicola sp. SB0662_bin_57]|nr:Ldh family oxidoreductase [Boseongicola sp. SB0662_bin_57]
MEARQETAVNLTAAQIGRVVQRILRAAGATESESERVGFRLANANLVGHDSHGLIRVCQYAGQLRDGTIRSGAELELVAQLGAVAIYDANLGFGQLAAELTTKEGIRKAQESGVSAIGLRNVSHVGRVGDWAELAAEQEVISFHFVNSPAKPGVSPFGGVERRMATNPVCIGYPVAGRDPLIVDMTTSAVAEGKLRVASAAGKSIPEGWVLDREGNPTTNPDDYYNGGAMLTMGAHKGYGLSLAIDLLAGAFTGGRTVSPLETVNRNNMFSIFVDSKACGMQDDANAIASSYLAWIKDCSARDPNAPVLIPGEPEGRERRCRIQSGIDVPGGVWLQVVGTAEGLGLSAAELT